VIAFRRDGEAPLQQRRFCLCGHNDTLSLADIR
jgi:hypothetical protein